MAWKVWSPTRTAGLKKVLLAVVLIWAAVKIGGNINNPEIPAGFAGYVYQRPSFLGRGGYLGIVPGPAGAGPGWQIFVETVDIRPRNFAEAFQVNTADGVPVKFNAYLKIGFDVSEPSLRALVEQYGKEWYENFLRPQFRGDVIRAVKGLNAAEVEPRFEAIRAEVLAGLKPITRKTPFRVEDVILGEVEFPEDYLAARQESLEAKRALAKKELEIELARLEARRAAEEAKGAAEAQRIISRDLTPAYLQYLGIQALKASAASPNTTVLGLPLGANLVPLLNLGREK